MSYGALFNTHTLLFENRYKGAILYVGGSFPTYPPLADGINHLPRIKTPFLILQLYLYKIYYCTYVFFYKHIRLIYELY